MDEHEISRLWDDSESCNRRATLCGVLGCVWLILVAGLSAKYGLPESFWTVLLWIAPIAAAYKFFRDFIRKADRSRAAARRERAARDDAMIAESRRREAEKVEKKVGDGVIVYDHDADTYVIPRGWTYVSHSLSDDDFHICTRRARPGEERERYLIQCPDHETDRSFVVLESD